MSSYRQHYLPSVSWSDVKGGVQLIQPYNVTDYFLIFRVQNLLTSALESGQPDLIYFFYDSDDTLVEDVIEELNAGVEYCSNFTPNQLEEIYIGKKGKLQFKNEKINKIIHPDDLKKGKQILCGEEFVCTDVQFQYLVVNNNSDSVRILPRVFKVGV